MKKSLHILFLASLMIAQIGYGQTKKVTKPLPKKTTVAPLPKEREYTKWSLKAGANLSVIFLSRNIKDKNNVPGYCGGLSYEVNNFVRVSTLYSHFKPLSIEPTWYDIKANTYEMNLEVMAKFPNKKTLFYPFAGVSYNTFSGYFTGELDYLNLKEFYKANTTIKNNWFGLNLGTGIEHNFGVLGLFVDYRMRVGKQDGVINIMDVCYTAGAKIRFPYGKLAKKMGHLNDRFYWF